MDGAPPPSRLTKQVGQETTPEPRSSLGPYEGGVGFLEHLRNELPGELDERVHAVTAKATGGFSPISLIGSYLDWYAHLLFAPGKQMQIGLKAWDKARRLAAYTQCALSGAADTPCIEPRANDHRFEDPAWSQFPFNLVHQQFLLYQQWQHNVFTGVPGVRPQHEALVNFTARQALDMLSPSNFFWTNPEVQQRTIQEGGANLARGALYFLDDAMRLLAGKDASGLEAFKVGENLATTRGKVVYRNHLVELIQYQPTTDQVYETPILIVPAWIMKYYILDLSANNSLVKYLTDQGHTVFIVSWRNPTKDDADLGLHDYLEQGVFQTVSAVKTIVGNLPLHLVGYCLGGTLAAIGAAAMKRRDQNAVKTLTLLAAQVDFSEAGELSLFISDSQLAFLEDLMKQQGVLKKDQMTGAFQMLRSNDLIWSKALKSYWMGERRPPNDLLAWNADGTRMPYRMHKEYLHGMYLNNDFAAGRFQVDGETASVADIKAPIFAVATTNDHVAPWRSVYKLHLLADTEITFLLTSGGHNAGIVSEPGHPRRNYRMARTNHGQNYLAPDRWEEMADHHEGSWWPAWSNWLKTHDPAQTEARAPTLTLCDGNQLTDMIDAPGTYVHEK